MNNYSNNIVKQQQPISLIQHLHLNLHSRHHVQQLPHIHVYRLSSVFSLYVFNPGEL